MRSDGQGDAAKSMGNKVCDFSLKEENKRIVWCMLNYIFIAVTKKKLSVAYKKKYYLYTYQREANLVHTFVEQIVRLRIHVAYEVTLTLLQAIKIQLLLCVYYFAATICCWIMIGEIDTYLSLRIAEKNVERLLNGMYKKAFLNIT